MMTGWKTWAAGIGSILWGIVGYVTGVHELDVAVGFVTGGAGILGIGHKIDKAVAGKADTAKAGE